MTPAHTRKHTSGPSASGNRRRRFGLHALLIGLVLLAPVSGTLAAPPEEAIIALDRYTTHKGKALASAFRTQLRQIYDRVYHCRPWLDIRKGGLGFTRRVGGSGDDRFLNIWVWVDQQITPQFAALSRVRRHSAMFSRHGIDLLSQLAGDPAIFADPTLTGYSVILTWLKPNGQAGATQLAETLGVFAEKGTVRAFLAQRLSARQFVKRATIVAFDGKEPLGRLPLEIWKDNFALTFKPKNHEPDSQTVRC